MNFDEEIAEAFGEVAANNSSSVRIFLTNQRIIGTIARDDGSAPIDAVGYEGRNRIVIAAPIAQFNTPPDATRREQVTVTGGPHAGRWSMVGTQADSGHYYLACISFE